VVSIQQFTFHSFSRKIADAEECWSWTKAVIDVLHFSRLRSCRRINVSIPLHGLMKSSENPFTRRKLLRRIENPRTCFEIHSETRGNNDLPVAFATNCHQNKEQYQAEFGQRL
jgi:hypothetical protein